MAKFSNDYVSFTIQDDVTVEQQLEYVSIITTFDKKDRLKNMWVAAIDFIEDWKCKEIPRLDKFDISKSTNPIHAQIITWVGTKVYEHLNSLDEISKN